MALSLVCQDCNTLLRSVKEAQDHADATGHSNFAESTQAVVTIVCTECGKACKSEVEKDLHTKHTGHATYEDCTGAAAAIDTEIQMAEARAGLADEGPRPAGGSDTAKDGPVSAAAAGEGDMVPAEVDESLVAALEEMGFPRNRAVRAIYSSGGGGADAAVDWLAEHEGTGAELDEPLLVPRATARAQLTPEEAKAQAAELLRRAKERREGEEREREHLREQERIRAGKELAAIARAEEDSRLRRMVEERQREKAEEERAREKIRRKLEEDRRERRRKLGLPEDLTEEEKEAERRKEREKAEEEAKRKLPVKPVAVSEKLRQLLVALKKAHPRQDEALRICLSTMLKFVTNVGSAPGEDKFRRIKLNNAAVQQRVAAFPGAIEFLELAGFKREGGGGEVLELKGEPDMMVLQAAAENLTSALNNPFFGML